MSIPTSPNLPDNDLIATQKQFSDVLTQELTDDEIQKAFKIMIPIIRKWQEKFRLKAHSPLFGVEDALKLIDKFEEELKYELATKLQVYAVVDVTPLFEGEPMVIEFQGALPDHQIAKYGFDHEKKGWEVTKATDRGEDYLGQKGGANVRKPSRSSRKSASS